MLRLTGVAGFVALMLLITLGCQRSKDHGVVTLEQWKEVLNRTLPPGTSRATVESFLNERAIEHSYLEKSNFAEEGNSIVAMIKDKDEKHVVRRAGIQLRFKFDKDQKLISSEAREVFTGP